MPSSPDSRYRSVRVVGGRDGREIHEAVDLLADRSVVLKIDPGGREVRELGILLALPPDVRASVWDASWMAGGTLHVALAPLRGVTLHDASSRIPGGRIPALAWSICDCLAQIHRCGVVHADLKPEHVILTEQASGFDVRLLDFGSAMSRIGDPLIEHADGGTPAFGAPELGRGWSVDGRADLYSLGVILRALLPQLGGDPRWDPILTRLTARFPANRFGDAVAARDEIARAFGLAAAPALPVFGCGPLRGRERALAEVLRRVAERPGVRLLIQSRPGGGLSRFLLECVVSAARSAGSPMRILDLGALSRAADGERLLRFYRDRVRPDEALLCGIPDPSPALGWMSDHRVAWLRGVVAEERWERIALPPIESGAIVEIVADSLGAGGVRQRSWRGAFMRAVTVTSATPRRVFATCCPRVGGSAGSSGISIATECAPRCPAGPPHPLLRTCRACRGRSSPLWRYARAPGGSSPGPWRQDFSGTSPHRAVWRRCWTVASCGKRTTSGWASSPAASGVRRSR